jgi:purine-binding chemotaxis protein CheW
MENDRTILKARAKRNAEKIAHIESLDSVYFLVFRVVKEIYAIENKWIKEVVKVGSFTTIPGTPDFVMGVANIRGNIYSAININRFLSAREYGLSELNKLIIISNGDVEYGFVADEIMGFSETRLSDISEVPDNYNQLYKEFVTGICKTGALILNGKALTESNKIIIE